jgi:hypothetical protein
MALPANSTENAPAGAGALTTASSEPLAYLDAALQDAERLLKHAAETGVDIDEETRGHILQARTLRKVGWDEEGSAHLLAALTKLAARLSPVTAESLNACRTDVKHTVRGYWIWAMWLAIVIVPLSLIGFVTSAISEGIRSDIVTANELAVKLTAQTHSQTASVPGARSAATGTGAEEVAPGLAVVDIVTELQQFASIIRAIDNRALQLHVLFPFEQDPSQYYRDVPENLRYRFQLPPDLPNHLTTATDGRIEVYQDVRYFAQSLVADSTFVFGAITTYLLPVLYALLGTCAYLLRSFEQDMKNKTFIPSPANSARFLIAGIGGGVVGLFNNFTLSQGASIPPLAVAFLVGYAVDVFFSFLESMLQAFTRSRSSVGAPLAAPLASKAQ